MSGLDVIGLTAGSLARLTQDREVELWGSTRIVSSASEAEVRVSSHRNSMNTHSSSYRNRLPREDSRRLTAPSA